MVISKTPFRISFLGGRTDLPSFFCEEEGAVLSTTIDKYVYITVKDRFDETYRLVFDKTEICASIDEIGNKITRCVLGKYDAISKERNGGRGLEISSVGDIPPGTGLGSSSSFTVGLLHALKRHVGLKTNAEELASEASRIEIEELNEPIGKQDQYAAARGGLQFLRFLPSGEVIARPVMCTDATKRELQSWLMLFYTGMTRSASNVLAEQKKNISQSRESLREMREMAYRLKGILEENRPIQDVAELMHEGWRLKKSFGSGVSNSRIDEWYDRAMEAGASGGKIVGAGGGGFLLMFCRPDKQEKVRQALSEVRLFPVSLESQGSRIIYGG